MLAQSAQHYYIFKRPPARWPSAQREAKLITKLIVFVKGGEYHCVVATEEQLKDIPEQSIFFEDKAEGESLPEMRAAIQGMKNKAKEWAQEQGIEKIRNLYP